MQAVLFIAALIFAIPTFGVSILVWLLIMYLAAKENVKDKDRMRSVVDSMSPMFRERYAEFFRALDIPMLPGQTISEPMAGQCGRHIVNYIAHNPDETQEFAKGLRLWATKGGAPFADPIEAAQFENEYNAKAQIHAVAYRAIEAMLSSNNMPCFRGVDRLEISRRVLADEFEKLASN